MDFIEIIKAIILGIVEGITEWLPISSTGHMILVDEFIKMDVSAAFMEMFLVVIQLGAIMAFCTSNGVKLQHCKPHGSLYNMAAKDMDLAMAIAEAIAEVDKDIILMGLAGSKMLEAGKQVGLRVASEVFADRAYQADGSLVPRSKPGAVIHDKDEAIARTIRMVTEGKVTAITGEEVSIDAHSICVHGDNPSAVEFVKNIRARLEAEGVTIAPISEIV